MRVASARQYAANSAHLISQLGDSLPPHYALSLQRTAAESCDLRDTNTDALWHQGKVLVHSHGRLTLWHGSERHTLSFEGDCPSLGAEIDDPAFRSALGSMPKLRRLIPGLHFNQVRYRGALLDDNAKICVRLLAWEVHAELGGGTLIQLQALRGYDRELALLEEALRSLDASTELSARDLFARLGYHGHGYVANRAVELRPDTPAMAAAVSIIRNNLAVARENEQGVIDDVDTEYLHDYRVSLRRVRSVLSLFKGVFRDDVQAELKSRFSGLMRSTNQLRDLDVYLLDRAGYYTQVPPGMYDGLDQIFAAFQRERDEEWRRLARSFRSQAYRAAVSELERRFAPEEHLPPGPMAQRPALDYARHLIARRYRKVCRVAMSIDTSTPDQRVHELRLQCKKLRYLLDFFRSLFEPAAIAAMVASLKQLQDNLGRFNDYSVQQIALQAFLDRELKKKISPPMIEAVGALVAIKHQAQLQERALVMEKFARFHSPETEALFAAHFSAGS